MKRRFTLRLGICHVWILGPGKFEAYCNKCDRPLATFSQHESAMNWAQAHARSKVHIKRGEVRG
jgi:hypothetical protein